MRRFDKWLRSKNIEPKRFYFGAIIISLVFILLVVINAIKGDSDNRIYLTEDAQIRTGPNASYPVLFNIREGEPFKVIGKAGKWLEVTSYDDKQKGWIAGWHTNLNIKEDENPHARPLKGKVIVIDPGHGGNDQGASSQTGKNTLEKDMTLTTSLELKDKLENEGAKVKLTRHDDTYVRLEDRKVTGDAFISIHNDALESNKANGATVYWYHEQQEMLAQTLNASIQKKGMLSNRGVRQENYQVLRQTDMPAVLLELGYISNPTDEVMIKDKNHRQVVENAVVEGLRNYFLS